MLRLNLKTEEWSCDCEDYRENKRCRHVTRITRVTPKEKYL